MTKEATARIKINKLLEEAGWRFFGDGDAPANIHLESSVPVKAIDLDALGTGFANQYTSNRKKRTSSFKSRNGLMDGLLSGRI